MEKFLKRDKNFFWDEKCQHILDVLKDKMVTAAILVLPVTDIFGSCDSKRQISIIQGILSP